MKAINNWDAPEVLTIYDRARELSAAIGPTPQMTPIYFGLWAHNLFHLNVERALQIADECVASGKRLARGEMILHGLIAQANTRYWIGELLSTRELCDEAAGIATDDTSRERFGQDPRALVLMFSMFSNWATGVADVANVRRQEMYDLIARVGHTFTSAIGLQATAWQSFHEHDAATTLADSQRLIALCEENHFPFYLGIGRLFHGWAVAVQGGSEGIDEAVNGYAVLTQFGGQMIQSLYAVAIGEACLAQQQIVPGLELVAKAIAHVEESGLRCYLSELHRVRGELLAARGDTAGAVASLREAVAVAAAQQAVAFQERAEETLNRMKEAVA